MLHLFADSAQFCLYSFTGFLREVGKDEKEETAPGQPADGHHIQVYCRPGCILWTSSYRQPCLSDSKRSLSFFHGCQNVHVFHEREKGQDRKKRGKEKKPGAIFLGFLPPETESFNSHLFMFKVSELGYTRGCSDFSPKRRHLTQEGINTVGVCPAHLLPSLEFLHTGFFTSASSECSRTCGTLHLKFILFVPPEENKINRKHPRTHTSIFFLGSCAWYMLSYPFTQLKEEIRKLAWILV